MQIPIFKHPFHSQYQWFDRQEKKNDNSRDQQDKGNPLELWVDK